MSEELVLLPQTAEELETFIADLTTEFKLPEGDETAYSITTMICHLPATEAYVKKSYFGHGVLRGVANKVAFEKNRVVVARLNAELEAKKKAEEEKTALTLVKEETTPVGAEPIQSA